MRFSYLNSINDIDAKKWNSITGTDYPFTCHEFLAALEQSGAVSEKTGWLAHHLVIYDQEQLIAVLPLYIKNHSYGEYVFDWAWADAYQRHGYDYYPKLLAAIPFTPASGPRLCVLNGQDKPLIYHAVAEQLSHHCQAINASSVHILFPQADAYGLFSDVFLPRNGVQFHWFNEGYTDFKHFLSRFSSRKRKNLNKERRQVIKQGVTLQRLVGSEISPDIWHQFYIFYQITYAKRSGHGGYLSADFFKQVADTMADKILLVVAIRNDQIIAGALNFFDSQTLYGRYWGCSEEVEYLHFEACYYQGIEFCIEHGLKRFDPGAQGEHKIQRGFTPITTYSSHWLAEANFARAIEDFLHQETAELKHYKQQCTAHLPFKDPYPQ